MKDQDLNIGDLPVEHALGVHWNIENDYLDYDILKTSHLLEEESSLQSAQHMIRLG